MALKLIPNAALYRVVLPSADDLAKHLAKLPHEELTPSAARGSGFVNVPFGANELVYDFAGWYAFSLQIDEKILPGSVVNSEVRKWIAFFTGQEDRRPGRKAIREAKERITATLLVKALVRTRIVTCLYQVEKNLLIVPALGKTLCGEVMGQLVRAVESVKSTTIHVSEVKGSLTTRLTSYMVGHDVDAFDKFFLGNKVVLVGPNGKSTFDLTEITDAADGVTEAITKGAQVSEIALALNGVRFRLTHDFLLKGIKFEDRVIAEQETEDIDEAVAFEHEAACQLLLVSNVVDTLCEMFGYKPPVEDDGSDLT